MVALAAICSLPVPVLFSVLFLAMHVRLRFQLDDERDEELSEGSGNEVKDGWRRLMRTLALRAPVNVLALMAAAGALLLHKQSTEWTVALAILAWVPVVAYQIHQADLNRLMREELEAMSDETD